jgi:DNA-directed RNA polymerase specialized sigma24 family protein
MRGSNVTERDRDWLAERFDERSHLRGVAYRMLGSLSEANDAVQDAWIRLSRSDASKIDNLGGWLTTVVARVCLNMLQARRARREEPFGVHVPDPILRELGWAPRHRSWRQGFAEAYAPLTTTIAGADEPGRMRAAA